MIRRKVSCGRKPFATYRRLHGDDGSLVEAARDEIAKIAMARPLQKPLLDHPAVIVHFRQVLVAGIADERDHPLRLGLFEAIALGRGDQRAGGGTR